MPGFIHTHHHQFETALRSFLADAILINDGRPESAHNYYELILQKLSMGYRPQDIYINELCAGVAQIDAGVTAVMDVSQIKKWRGAILGHDIPKLRAELEASRDHLFAAMGIERDLFRA